MAGCVEFMFQPMVVLIIFFSVKIILQMYTEAGELVAVMTQEGVVRADIRDPSKAKL